MNEDALLDIAWKIEAEGVDSWLTEYYGDDERAVLDPATVEVLDRAQAALLAAEAALREAGLIEW